MPIEPDVPIVGPGNFFLPFEFYSQSQEDDTTFTTTSVTPVVALTLTTPSNMPAGTYRLDWYGETFQSAVANSASVNVRIDGTDVAITRHGDEVDILDVLERGGFAVRVLTAGAHTITLNLSTTAGTASYRRRRLFLVRVAA